MRRLEIAGCTCSIRANFFGNVADVSESVIEIVDPTNQATMPTWICSESEDVLESVVYSERKGTEYKNPHIYIPNSVGTNILLRHKYGRLFKTIKDFRRLSL